MRLLHGVRQWLDTLLAPAEDPRQTPLGTLMDQHRRALETIRTCLQEVEAANATLLRRVQQLDGERSSCEEQAGQELQRGREDLARVWLQRKRAMQVERDRLESQSAELTREQARLIAVEHQLIARLEVVATQEGTVRARYVAAEMQSRVNQTLAVATTDLAALELPLSEIEERAEWMRARAQALDELSASTWGESASRNLPHDPGVEADLDRLRAEREVRRDHP